MTVPLRPAQVEELFGLAVNLREQAFWRLLYDSGAPAAEVLALDANWLDLPLHRVRARPGDGARADIEWQETTSQILRWLLSGRAWGPVFLTDRKAPARTPTADVCPLTGQARMSYRRAAEIFAAFTRPLDPAGRAGPCTSSAPQGVYGAAGRKGKTTSMPRPPWGRGMAVMAAPWASAMARTMARPSPCPSPWRIR